MIHFLVPTTFALMQIPLDVNVEGKVTLKEGAEGGEETCAQYYIIEGGKKEKCAKQKGCYWAKNQYAGGTCLSKKRGNDDCDVDEECLSALCVKGMIGGRCDGASFDHHAVTEWIHKTPADEIYAQPKECSEYERNVFGRTNHVTPQYTEVSVSLLHNKYKKVAVFSFKVETETEPQQVEEFYELYLIEWVQGKIDSFEKNNEDRRYKITMTGKGRGALVALAARKGLKGKVRPRDAYLMMYNLPELPQHSDMWEAQDTDFCKTTRMYPRMTRENICSDKKEEKSWGRKMILAGKVAGKVALTFPLFIPVANHDEKKKLRKETREEKVFDFFACQF